MPLKINWTEQADTYLVRARLDGATWDAIARALRVSRWAVLGRGGSLGIRGLASPPPPPRALMDRTREPLPAGHRLSWGLLTEGTLLEGSPYAQPGPYASPSEGRD